MAQGGNFHYVATLSDGNSIDIIANPFTKKLVRTKLDLDLQSRATVDSVRAHEEHKPIKGGNA